MNGKQVFKHAVKRFPEVIIEGLDFNNLKSARIGEINNMTYNYFWSEKFDIVSLYIKEWRDFRKNFSTLERGRQIAMTIDPIRELYYPSRVT